MSEAQESKPRSLRYIAVLNYITEAEELMMETLAEPNSTNILIVAQMLQKADLAMSREEIDR